MDLKDLKYILEYVKHIKEMEKNGSNKGSQAKVGFIKWLVDKKTEDIIATKNEELNTVQKINIKKEVKANLEKRIKRVGLTITAIVAAAGIGVKAGSVLTEGKYNGIEIAKDEVSIAQSKVGNIDIVLDENKVVTISKDNWEESLKVDTDAIKEIQTLLEKKRVLKETVKNEIDTLTDAESVQTYLKEMYLEKYNQENHTNYTKEEVKIGTNRADVKLYKDEAENGDVILRKEYNTTEKNDKDLLQIYIAGDLVEQGAIFDDVYQYVYQANEVVAEAKEANSLGKALIVGIDYVTALENQEENSSNIIDTYKSRLIEAVAEYRGEKMQEISNEDLSNKNVPEERE